MTEDHGDDEELTALDLDEEDPAHGIERAVYTIVEKGENHQPTLECCCGQTFQGESWEEAGAEFDAHLAEAEGEDPELLEGFVGFEVVK